MAIRNYLKVFADGHTEATVEKPAFGEVSATGDYYINGLWYDKLGVVYPTQFTYMAKDDKLASFLIEDGQPVDITYDYDSPSIVQDVIQAKDMVVVDKLKINNTEWLNDGVDYDDPDAIGANPVAKIYPDGTIVGSTDNGSYVKYPNGELEVRRRYKSPEAHTTSTTVLGLSGYTSQNATIIQYPIAFTNNDISETFSIQNRADSNAIIYCPLSSSNITRTASSLFKIVNSKSLGAGFAHFVDYTAKGRWKL